MPLAALAVLVAALACAGPAVASSAAKPGWQPPSGAQELALWPGPAPDTPPYAEPETSSGSWVTFVSTPTLTFFPAQGKDTGAAVVVFPGGGFMGLAMGLEGTEICDWLTSRGISCALLKYRVPRSEDYYEPKLHRHVVPKVQTAFQDAQRAISLVRARAKGWGIEPDKIGVMGFSAGGYLAARTAVEFQRRSYRPVDDADKESCRPDFSVPVYPGHLWKPPEGSSELRLNPRLRVTSRTPPTFLLMAEDDPVDHVEQVLTYYRALQKAGVPVEMHLYAQGGHAFGLRPTKLPISRWPALVETWLKTIGVLP